MEGKTDALDVSFLISLYSYSRIKHLLPWEIWEFLLAHYSEITSPQASKYSLWNQSESERIKEYYYHLFLVYILYGFYSLRYNQTLISTENGDFL